MKKLIYIGYLLLAFAALSCVQDVITLEAPPPPPSACPAGSSKGSADFTKFIAIGNSLTAGYQSGALFTDGQNESMPKILAKQFECVGGSTTFNQPDINSTNGYNATFSNPMAGVVLGRLILFDPDGTGPKSAGPAPAGMQGIPAPYNTADLPTPYTGDKTKLNNFGVPGILLGQALIPDTGNPASPYYNGYWARFASQPGVKSIMEDAVTALANGGSFFLFDLGNNDVLGYAVAGADNSKASLLTTTANFTTQYTSAINALLSVPNVKGVVGNIPHVTTIPYFTTVPYNPIPLDKATADLLNAGFVGYNSILDALKGPPFNLPAASVDARKIAFNAGYNKIVIIDESVTSYAPYFDGLLAAGAISSQQRAALAPYEQVRQTTSADLVTLGAAAVLGTTVGGNASLINGLTVPLVDKWILIPSEITEIQTRVNDFNIAIATIVANSNNRIALADINKGFSDFVTAKAAVQDGVTITPSIAPPFAAFSEDGVHPNGRGYAYMANMFIEAINVKFGATIPKANILKYKGTRTPVTP